MSVSTAIITAHAAFIESGVAIELATRDAANQPHLTIGCGCRTDAAEGRVTILVNRLYSAAFLAALDESGAVAVNFGRPSDHHAIQLKARDARLTPPSAGDAVLVESYQAAFADDMLKIGFSRNLTAAYLALAPVELVAVSFAPVAAYTQTPGPAAGQPLL